MEEIRAQMSTIEDPRHPSYVKYALTDILIIIMCGVLCGLDMLRERFGAMGEVIAVDGKAICSTARGENSHKALQILSAYVTDSGIILAQEAIHEKTNEIPVFQEMLTYLDVESKVVTADVMHCQRETSRWIVQKKGDYLFGLGGLKRGFAVKQPIFPGWRSTNGPDCEVYLRLSGSWRTTDITAKKQAITFPAGTPLLKS